MNYKYTTNNEMQNFDFTQAIVVEMKQMRGYFYTILNNVIILPDNSCNRDIWEMSTNNLRLTINEGSIESIIEEGYKKYDADDKLLEEVKDKNVEKEQYNEILATLPEAYIYSFDNKDGKYVICVDTEEHGYKIEVKGKDDVQEWDRFMKKAMA